MKQNQNLLGGNTSVEELKIRGELESEIERILEEEIKDGIYHLALRLHRLHQHKKERKGQAAGELLDSGDKRNNKTLLEVKIIIRMEGGTKIEIKEIKKEAPEWSSRSENARVSTSNNKKFDWEKSLRSGRSHPTANIMKKINHRTDNAGISSSLRPKGSVNGVDHHNKVHEAGWKW